MKPSGPKHSSVFDLAPARVSICIDLIGYIGMAFGMSSVSWSTASVLRAFGGGFGPGTQSVAHALYESAPNQGIETGKLFGGLIIIRALK